MKNLYVYIIILIALFSSLEGYSTVIDSYKFLNDTVKSKNTGDDTTKKDRNLDKLVLEDSLAMLSKKIQIEFISKKVEHSSDSTYFNVCKITNTETRPISGRLEFRAPTNWNLIANPSMDVTLEPGETMALPIRVSIPPNAIGGIAYVIDASVTTNEGVYSGNAYVKIPLKSKWNIEVDQHTIYFNEYFDETVFRLNIKNQGNSPELLLLDFKVGKLLEIIGLDKNQKYVEIPPKTDTVFEFSVQNNQEISSEERILLTQSWNESVIDINVLGANNIKKRESIWFKNLENEYLHGRQEMNTPLNFNLSVFNLLSPSQPQINLSVFGQLLFNNNHDIDYMVSGRNIYRNGEFFGPSYAANPNFLNYRLRYNWNKKIHAELGDITGFTMHTNRGRGIKGHYILNKNSKIKASYTSSRYYPDWIGAAKFESKFKKINYSVGLVYEDNTFRGFNAGSVELGVGISPVKNHFIRATLLGTNLSYNRIATTSLPALDTSLLGFSYRFSYGANLKKLRLTLSTTNNQYNYLRFRANHTINGNASYKINHKSRINAFGNYRSTRPSRVKETSFYKGYYSENQIYRATYTYTFSSSITAQIGPSFRIFRRQKYVDTIGITSDFTNFFYGIYANSRVKLSQYNAITPIVSIGQTSFINPLTSSFEAKPRFTARVGLNFTSRNYGAQARYTYGPNVFLSQDFFIYDNSATETISLRANADKYLRERTIKLTGFATYYLRLPANRQSFVLSGRSEFKLPKGWSTNITANIYTNSIDDENNGIQTHRFFSLNAGVKKAFGIQQPRIKYYDLTVICFNDYNGNGVREENEPLLPNIKVKVTKNEDVPEKRDIRWAERELITSTDGGSIYIENIPNTHFKLEFDPLFNLGNLYNVNGDVQEFTFNENTTLYVPYVQSYKVFGNIIMIRDEYSSKGTIKVGGIRVTASNAKGEVFAALTNNEGSYVINVPQAGYYSVKVNNIFGEGFYIDKEKFLIQFDGYKQYNLDFTFYEGKRKINFGNGGSIFDFDALNEAPSTTPAIETDSLDSGSTNQDNLNIDDGLMEDANKLKKSIADISKENEKNISTPVDPNKVKYMVELGLFDGEIDTDIANAILTLGFTPTPIKIGGMTIYSTPQKSTHAEIQALLDQIKELGFDQAIVVGSYEGRVITEGKAREYREE